MSKSSEGRISPARAACAVSLPMSLSADGVVLADSLAGATTSCPPTAFA
jgi:hypothetical protein